MPELSTKADDIARVIEDEIVGGVIPPGTVLRQETLSERFDVSRTPVREALRRLAALGLVSFEPNRGVRVRSISAHELREAFLVRAELEALATEVATPKMTPDDLAEMDRIERRFGELTLELRDQARSGAPRDASLFVEWMQANYAFHDVVYRVADLPLVERIAKSARRTFIGRPRLAGPGRARRSSTRRTTSSTAPSARRSAWAARRRRASSRASTCSRRTD